MYEPNKTDRRVDDVESQIKLLAELVKENQDDIEQLKRKKSNA